MSKKVFEAVLMSHPKFKGSAYIEIPFDVYEVYGKKGQVKVKATFDSIPYRGSLVKMGTPFHIIPILKGIREELGKTHGDVILVELEEDTEPRTVDIPENLQKLLDENPKAQKFFDTLAYTYRKEYVNWITGAKRETTRQSRLTKAIDKLNNGIKAP